MRSMTGFAHREHNSDTVHMVLEIKSYNNRYLDLSVTLPGALSVLEPEVRALVGARLSRGRVEVTVRLRELARNPRVRVDSDAVAAYRSALETVRTVAGIPEPVTLADILRFDDVLVVEHERDLDAYRELLLPMLDQAMDDLDTARQTEGQATERDIRNQLERVSVALKIVENVAPQMEASLTENIRTRFAEVVGDQADEARIYTETAVLLVKYSINEELSRMSSHLAGFAESLGLDEPIGKRLDFLCQEINREINTIGSKSFVLDVSRQVVEMKDALENIREQLRNIE
ncbi:MAG: YicC family protein [Spirochaetaceae bacterium]|nr:MAG: YicC family protein [Spirochaetaceae bacterium]